MCIHESARHHSHDVSPSDCDILKAADYLPCQLPQFLQHLLCVRADRPRAYAESSKIINLASLVNHTQKIPFQFAHLCW
jgi:hypothetical protein